MYLHLFYLDMDRLNRFIEREKLDIGYKETKELLRMVTNACKTLSWFSRQLESSSYVILVILCSTNKSLRISRLNKLPILCLDDTQMTFALDIFVRDKLSKQKWKPFQTVEYAYILDIEILSSWSKESCSPQ